MRSRERYTETQLSDSDRKAALLMVLLFWACTFGVLSVRGIFYEPGPASQTMPPRAAVTAVGALLCVGMALALSRFRIRSFPALISLALSGALLLSGTQAWLHLRIYDWWYPQPVGPTGSVGLLLWTIFWLGYFLAWTGTYFALVYHRDVRRHEHRLTALRDLAQEAQIAALRYQINPHFLFNTINSISAFVLESRSHEAERMLTNLADFLRATIHMDPGAIVPLGEELSSQEKYLDIEKVRFSNRMKVSIEVPVELRAAPVPALLLQPLVENAVTHGVARSEAPVTISIFASSEGDSLVVSVLSDGAADPARPGTGTGLRNVRERLQAYYGDEAQLTAASLPTGGFLAEVKLPFDRPVGSAAAAEV